MRRQRVWRQRLDRLHWIVEQRDIVPGVQASAKILARSFFDKPRQLLCRPIFMVLNGKRHLGARHDGQRAIDRGFTVRDKRLPIRQIGKIFVASPAEAPRTQAHRTRVFGRLHAALECAGVFLRQLDHHFDIHGELAGARAQFLEIRRIERGQRGLDAARSERIAIFQEFVGIVHPPRRHQRCGGDAHAGARYRKYGRCCGGRAD